MKTLTIPIFAIAIFTLAGCGNGGKAGYAVDELADIAVANKEAFMEREVTVSGYISNFSHDLDNDGFTLSLDFDPYSPVERQLSCTVPHGRAPDGIRDKWVTVKGKIVKIHSQSYMDLKSVWLEPCDLVRAD